MLRAWRLLAEPTAGLTVPAEPNVDHRPAYLDYEGPVSGGRGTVTRWDAGTYTGDVGGAGGWEVVLAGRRLSGPARMAAAAGGWEFKVG